MIRSIVCSPLCSFSQPDNEGRRRNDLLYQIMIADDLDEPLAVRYMHIWTLSLMITTHLAIRLYMEFKLKRQIVPDAVTVICVAMTQF